LHQKIACNNLNNVNESINDALNNLSNKLYLENNDADKDLIINEHDMFDKMNSNKIKILNINRSKSVNNFNDKLKIKLKLNLGQMKTDLNE